MCDCHSYVTESGENREVVLHTPDDFDLRRADGEPKTSVSVDACIAGVIKHLWANRVMTLSSCCGHGKRLPSIVLEQEANPTDALRVRNLISEIDNRQFELYSWRLTAV